MVNRHPGLLLGGAAGDPRSNAGGTMAAASTALGRQDGGDSASKLLSSGALEFGARPTPRRPVAAPPARRPPARASPSPAGRARPHRGVVGKAHSFFVHASIAFFSSYRQKTSALMQRGQVASPGGRPCCVSGVVVMTSATSATASATASATRPGHRASLASFACATATPTAAAQRSHSNSLHAHSSEAINATWACSRGSSSSSASRRKRSPSFGVGLDNRASRRSSRVKPKKVRAPAMCHARDACSPPK